MRFAAAPDRADAELSGLVQVGGVRAPPDLQGRGRARCAVALHLADARARGATRAALYAATEPALRACRTIGFRRTGRFAFVLLDGADHV